eukprot:10031859-Lingulodinium_polyedra.AAC.1
MAPGSRAGPTLRRSGRSAAFGARRCFWRLPVVYLVRGGWPVDPPAQVRGRPRLVPYLPPLQVGVLETLLRRVWRCPGNR